MAREFVVVDYSCYLTHLPAASREHAERTMTAAVLDRLAGASVALRHDGDVTHLAVDFAMRAPAPLDKLATTTRLLRETVTTEAAALGATLTDGACTVR